MQGGGRLSSALGDFFAWSSSSSSSVWLSLFRDSSIRGVSVCRLDDDVSVTCSWKLNDRFRGVVGEGESARARYVSLYVEALRRFRNELVGYRGDSSAVIERLVREPDILLSALSLLLQKYK